MQDQSPPSPSAKYQAKRERILDAASVLINERGVKGLTFAEAAEAVGLNATSVTYYFKRKEVLAEAVLSWALEARIAMALKAGAAPDPRARVSALLRAVLDSHAAARRGEGRALANLMDMRVLPDAPRARLMERYKDLLRAVMAYFPEPDAAARTRNAARAQVILECVHWLRAWAPSYSIADFDRVHAKLIDLFDHGILQPGATWDPRPLAVDDAPIPSGPRREVDRDAFLRAATILLNERGYRGASVEAIAARLDVSKGSFYHHLDAKEDLALACYQASYDRVSRAQRRAIEGAGPWSRRLVDSAAALLEVQFERRWPLLRTTAMASLPGPAQDSVLRRSDRMAQRFAGMMIDGVAEGSVRPVDPLIASQCLMAALNGAADFHLWAARRETRAEAAALFAAPVFFGLFDDRPV